MKRGILICIIGVDGSGKTTITKPLAEILNRNFQGKFKYVHGIAQPIFFRRITRFGKTIFGSQMINHDYDQIRMLKKNVFTKYTFLAKIYSLLTFLETVPQVFIKISVPRLLGVNILADRYFIDMLVDLSIFLDYSDIDILNSLNKYKYFLPWPDQIFHVDVSPAVAFKRKNDVPTVEYIVERQKIYGRFARIYNPIMLNGEKKIGYLRKLIINQIIKAELVENGSKNNE